MDIKALIQEMRNAETEAERENIKGKITAQFRELTNEDKIIVREAFIESWDNTIAETKEFVSEVDIAVNMAEISKYISLSQIAKAHFGKSKEWLYQRIKGYNVNGKPARFTDEERKILSSALSNIARMIESTSLKIT